ncbi:MAG TPA: glycoside hydrolase, partial [bacterium]|nr:glycoside hydrolase [bacterium]
MKTLYLIHHTHTDVGYTELQGRVERWQHDFIRQALDIIESTRERVGTDFDGFRWQCETFWGVERFLERADEAEAGAFAEAVREGSIGLSGSYLNMSELPGRELHEAMLARAQRYADSIGVRVDSAMTADINGYGWGYAQALNDAGVENLFTCVHTHHGMYPLGAKQVPFWWETPRGDRVLVWSGEHYHHGNVLGLVPGAVSSFQTEDDCDAEMLYHDPWGVAEKRIPRYLDELEASGYDYDFVPLMASGLRSDNAPPSERIADHIARWNAEHGDICTVRMVTLTQFFERLRADAGDVPVHRGDWPDWWSDGFAGDPEGTMLFRRAQRDFERHGRLLERYPELARPDTRKIEDLLALYAEHTFSHSFSVVEPWDPLVHAISERKRGFAAAAHDGARELVEDALRKLGKAPLTAGRGLAYRAVNTHDHAVAGPVRLPVGHFEFHDLGFGRGVALRDVEADSYLPCQLMLSPPGAEILAHVELEAGEERLFELTPADRPDTVAAALRVAGVECPATAGDGGVLTGSDRLSDEGMSTPFVEVVWRPGNGIVGWTDRALARGLLRPDRRHGAFTPVHEVTPVSGPEDVWGARGRMDLNRKGANAVRSSGCLVGAKPLQDGEVFVSARLDYGVAGCSVFLVELTAFLDAPRVDVAVRMHKDSMWEPENVYLSLPFGSGSPG